MVETRESAQMYHWYGQGHFSLQLQTLSGPKTYAETFSGDGQNSTEVDTES
jgi:hypothetical protein